MMSIAHTHNVEPEGRWWKFIGLVCQIKIDLNLQENADDKSVV